MPDDPKAQEAQEERDETVKQHEQKREKGQEPSIEDQSVKPFYYGKPQYKSDLDRRKELAEEQGHAEKYVVTEANPSTGGVYPPSAVVTPYDPEVVATHTPGETVEEENERSPDPTTPASLKQGTGPEKKEGEVEPAATTTPAG